VAIPLRRTLRLEAPRSWQLLNLAELWEYRELLYFFVWRDVKVRYKQTVLGAAWAIIQPLTTTFAFTLLFGRFGGMAKQVDGPYVLHVFVGMLPWTFFTNAVVQAANSLTGSSHLISKF
jgi:lipopolysaccharide transport system permease protein